MWYPKSKLYIFRWALLVCLAIACPGSSVSYAKARARIDTMDAAARARFNAALREMRKRGLRPRVNSTFRTKAEQQTIYRCARNRRCRARRGVYGAKPPGTSMHEAGLAVDLGGIAHGRRRRRLTPQGKQTVKIMRKHGFVWRYGLRDPAHFELSPQKAGYRSSQAAIKAGQQRWHKQRPKRRARR
jgi:LAS superfamily LD-carboxypeptidase LdcB